MAGKGIPELLNYKQKGKDLNEFIKVPVSKTCVLFWRSGADSDVYHDNNSADLFLYQCCWNFSRSCWNDHAFVPHF